MIIHDKYLKIQKKSKKTIGGILWIYIQVGIEIIFKLAKLKNIDFNILGGFKVDKDELLKFNKIPKNVNFISILNIGIFRIFKDGYLIAPYKENLVKLER